MSDTVPIGFTSIPEALELLESKIAGHEKFTDWAREWISEPEQEADRSSRLLAARHELSTEKLWAAFHSGALAAYVRDLKTGEPSRILKEDWWGDTSWEIWLRSGRVSVSTTQPLWEHNGRRLFIRADRLDEFLKSQRRDSTADRRGGAPAKADWSEIQKLFNAECQKRGCPDNLNEKGWQTQADIAGWIARVVENEGVGVSNSTYKKYAKIFMNEVEA